MRIKEIRQSRGISQATAARDLNLSQTVYNRYENGVREPSAIILSAIADYYGVTVDELLGRPAPDERKEKEDADVMEIREQLRRDPNTRMLFYAARTASPEHIRAAAAMLKALEPEDME